MNLIKVPGDLVAKCAEFGQRCADGYANRKKEESRYYSTHGIESNPVALSEAKVAECAQAIWLNMDPITALDWSDRPDNDYDILFGNTLRIDVKQTKLSPSYKRLYWPAKKAKILEKKKFDVFSFIKVQGDLCGVAGWISKQRFLETYRIATAADRIAVGDLFVFENDLWPMSDFKHEHWQAQISIRCRKQFEYISGKWLMSGRQ